MAIPVLKLNLVPEPTYWRRNHETLGWTSLAAGLAALALVLGLTFKAHRAAAKAGREIVAATEEARRVARLHTDVQNQLRAIDVAKELPRWKLAEKVLGERSLPWSRLSAELERCLPQDARLRSVQRARDQQGIVTLKLKGEARSRDAEVTFMEALQADAVFSQVALEREAERQGGGLDFDATLTLNPEPPPYQPLPTYAPPVRKAEPVVKPARTGQAAPARPAPQAAAPARPAVPAPLPRLQAPPVPPAGVRPQGPMSQRPSPGAAMPPLQRPAPPRPDPAGRQPGQPRPGGAR